MHLVLMTRGIQHQVDQWANLLQAQRFPWVRRNLETGKEEQMLVQGALRPIQLWEYVFPEESLDDVLGAMQIKGPIERPEIKSSTWALRKMLKLKQIPKKDELTVTGYTPKGTLNGEKMPSVPVHNMFVEGVAVYPVGIKDDQVPGIHCLGGFLVIAAIDDPEGEPVPFVLQEVGFFASRWQHNRLGLSRIGVGHDPLHRLDDSVKECHEHTLCNIPFKPGVCYGHDFHDRP